MKQQKSYELSKQYGTFFYLTLCSVFPKSTTTQRRGIRFLGLRLLDPCTQHCPQEGAADG